MSSLFFVSIHSLTERWLAVSLISRGAVIIADIIVLTVTLAKTLGTFREARRLSFQVPLVEILVRDGQLTIILMTQYCM